MKRFDLHVHTHYSKCSNMKPQQILKTAAKKGLDGIAITDHDIFQGARAVARLNRNKEFEVIRGMELTTNKCHLLALYLTEEIHTHDFFEALDEIERQDGIAVIAHPFSYLRGTLKADIRKIHKLIAVEAYNGRAFPFENKKAEHFAFSYKFPKTAGSDAHFLQEIGRGMTVFEDDLRMALEKRKTSVEGDSSSALYACALSTVRKVLR